MDANLAGVPKWRSSEAEAREQQNEISLILALVSAERSSGDSPSPARSSLAANKRQAGLKLAHSWPTGSANSAQVLRLQRKLPGGREPIFGPSARLTSFNLAATWPNFASPQLEETSRPLGPLGRHGHLRPRARPMSFALARPQILTLVRPTAPDERPATSGFVRSSKIKLHDRR